MRRKSLYEKSHIPGAINIPFNEYNSFKCSDVIFKELSKDKMNYVYCYSLLCQLGKMACLKFASLGYPVTEMIGGFEYWIQYKYDTNTNHK